MTVGGIPQTDLLGMDTVAVGVSEKRNARWVRCYLLPPRERGGAETSATHCSVSAFGVGGDWEDPAPGARFHRDSRDRPPFHATLDTGACPRSGCASSDDRWSLQLRAAARCRSLPAAGRL